MGLSQVNRVNGPRDFTHLFTCLEQCMEYAKTLGLDQEGFVVVDNQFNRVTVKGDVYVRAHHFASKMIKPSVLSCLKILHYYQNKTYYI